VHERPPGLADSELLALLSAEWDLGAASLEYLPVGFGGYHWRADAAGSRWFVTASDPPGRSATRAAADFEAAMETAARLARAGLDFVLAPVRGRSGRTVARLGPRYVITVFPYANGTPGHWDDVLTSAEMTDLLGMLAVLHDATSIIRPGSVPVRELALAEREVLTQALRERGETWLGGPFAEPARARLSEHADDLVRALARFDDLVAAVRADGRSLVVTHGEPHPGNLVRAGSGLLLVDWDTVGLAPPERDLWGLVPGARDVAARYTALTGREVSQDALALYRLRWTLEEVSLFLAEFRGTHERTVDTEVSWSGFCDGLASLAAD
jgi:spectinomycin phosphotransferase